jgi:predicted transcriptional regulator
MKIRFPVQLFGTSPEKKISILLPETMLSAVDRLAEVLGLDRSKTIRWSIEQVLKEAIEQGKIIIPGSDNDQAAG